MISLSFFILKWLSKALTKYAPDKSLIAQFARKISPSQRPGKIRVTMLDADKYLPSWTSKIMWRALPDFVHNNRTQVLDLEVMRPGVVRLQGVFVADDAALAITEEKLYLLRPELNGPVAIVGGGEGTVIEVSGPITRAAIGL